MSNSRTLPKYTGDLAGFVGMLRHQVFSSQAKAATHFQRSRSTIVRYEGGQLKARLDYIAALAQTVIEQGQHPVEARETLLRHINRAIREHHPDDVPFASWSELEAVANDYYSQSPARFEAFLQDFKLKQHYTPREKLPVSNKVLNLVQELDFIGIKWSNVFCFTVGLIKADDLSREQIQTISERFVAFNNLLYRHPKELQIPGLVWLVAFTLGGGALFCV